MELVSIVVNYRTPDLLRKFLASYDMFVHNDSRALIVADVDPVDDVCQKIITEEFPYVEYQSFDTNVGYAKAVNGTLALCELKNTEFIGIFNSDCMFLDNLCVNSCLDVMRDDAQVGVVGPKQVDSRNKITHGGIFGRNNKPSMRGWMEPDRGKYNDVLEAVTLSGSALFTRTDIWSDLTHCGFYSDAVFDLWLVEPSGAFLPTQHFYEETYFIYHLRHHGYKAIYNGEAKMLHEWHKSSPVGSKVEVMRESQEAFRYACDVHGIERD